MGSKSVVLSRSVVPELHHLAGMALGSANRTLLAHLQGANDARPAEDVSTFGGTSTVHLVIAYSAKHTLRLLAFLHPLSLP